MDLKPFQGKGIKKIPQCPTLVVSRKSLYSYSGEERKDCQAASQDKSGVWKEEFVVGIILLQRLPKSMNAVENIGFWESPAEFPFEDLHFWLLLVALGPSCYPFLVHGVPAIFHWKKDVCGCFLTRQWSYIYPVLLVSFSSSFQYL